MLSEIKETIVSILRMFRSFKNCVTAVSFTAIVVLLLVDKIDKQTFAVLLPMVMGFSFGANVWQKSVGK